MPGYQWPLVDAVMTFVWAGLGIAGFVGYWYSLRHRVSRMFAYSSIVAAMLGTLLAASKFYEYG